MEIEYTLKMGDKKIKLTQQELDELYRLLDEIKSPPTRYTPTWDKYWPISGTDWPWGSSGYSYSISTTTSQNKS